MNGRFKLPTYFNLSQIDVGFADGEKEAELANFLDIFYDESKKYEEIMKKHKFIVAGRKGTGKTILAKYIQKNNKNKRKLISYTKLSDIELHECIDVETSNISEKDRLLFQEFYIYKQFLILVKSNIIKYADFIKNDSSLLKKIKSTYKYILYRYKLNKINAFYNKVYDPKKVFRESEIKVINRCIQNSGAGVNIDMGVSPKFNSNLSNSSEVTEEITYEKQTFTGLLEQFKNFTYEISKYIEFILIIDNLDDIKTTSLEHSYKFLIKLIKTINEINMSFQKKRIDSKCIVLIRSDILNKFASRDSNIQKVLTDSTVKLNWFGKANYDELSRMFMHKIKNSSDSKCFLNVELDEMKRVLFPKARNQGTKRKAPDGFKYMIDHSFGRPRDITNYINVVKEKYPKKNAFKFDYVKDSLLEYSVLFLQELKNEMSFSLDSTVIEQIFELFKSFGKSQFDFNTINNFFLSRKDCYSNITSLKVIFEILYSLGVVGNCRFSENTNDIIYSWSYRENAKLEIDFNETIKIHPALYRALNI